MRNRQKQRELRRTQRKEAMINKRNSCGVKDLTAYNVSANDKMEKNAG